MSSLTDDPVGGPPISQAEAKAKGRHRWKDKAQDGIWRGIPTMGHPPAACHLCMDLHLGSPRAWKLAPAPTSKQPAQV